MIKKIIFIVSLFFLIAAKCGIPTEEDCLKKCIDDEDNYEDFDDCMEDCQ